MKRRKIYKVLTGSGSVAILAGTLIVSGCNNKPIHPNEKSALTNALNSNDLSDVRVSQDQDKGVLRLTGDVTSEDQKLKAEALAGQAAPGYVIANEIGVRLKDAESHPKSVDSSMDTGIEGNFKASLILDKRLDHQTIDFIVKNGTLVLKGTVATTAQKAEAGKLARAVPSVQQVANQIDVKTLVAANASQQSGMPRD